MLPSGESARFGKQEAFMLTGIHFLLTYQCTSECDHCFLYCSPDMQGTFTLAQIRNVFAEIEKMKSVKWVYVEGGEPFLYYPLMLETLRIARKMGLSTGVVTNAYWATGVEDAGLWLKPFPDLRVRDVSVSGDELHRTDGEGGPAEAALAAANMLGLPAEVIRIEKSCKSPGREEGDERGEPITGGSVRMRGRAVEKLAGDMPRIPWTEFTDCPHEDLEDPERVHVDAFGYVHLCQGLCMGNMWEIPLSTLVKEYDPRSHPICEPLLRGGPAMLSEQYGTPREDAYIDACHFCYLVRRSLVDRFPQYLAPRQVYGFEE
jgi:hypothetical protein